MSRPTSRAEFFALEQAAYAELTATWRGLPQAALVAPGASGPAWSIKDVMNHLAAWMQATRQVLPSLLASEKLPKGAYRIPDFNARHYAADQARSLPSSRRHLARARRALLHYIATLPPEVLINDSKRPGRWIKYALHGHYHEHLRALKQFRKRTLGE